MTWLIWILGTVIPTLILAGLSIQHQPDSTPKKRRRFIALVCILTGIVSTVGFLDSSKTAENIEKIVSGVVQVSENLNKQQQDLKDQRAGLGKQSQDLKQVGSDLRQVGSDLKQVGSELTQQSADLKATMQVARLNLAAVLDLQYQNASHNEIEADYSALESNLEWQVKLLELDIDERILKEERLFRDALSAVSPAALQALNQALIGNLQGLVEPIKQLEKNRQEVLKIIGDSRKQFPIRPEFIDSVLQTIQSPIDATRLPKLIEEFGPSPSTPIDLRNRVAVYSDLVFEYRRINTQIAAALRQWNIGFRAESYTRQTKTIDKQRIDLLNSKTNEPPQKPAENK
jgi:hypothetical protein